MLFGITAKWYWIVEMQSELKEQTERNEANAQKK